MNLTIKTTLDRIENGIAVLLVRPEEIITIRIHLSLLPEGTKEGDILNIEITKEIQETEQAKERVSSLINKLKNKK